MSDDRKAKLDGPRSPARVMQLVRELAKSIEPVPLASLAMRLSLPKTSLLSLLRGLSDGYVEQTRGGYRLGNQTLEIGAAIAAQIRFQPLVHEILERLSRASDETTQYGVLAPDASLALCVDMVESAQPLRYSLSVGLRRPLYCTSIGKLILAHQSDEWLDNYFRTTKLETFTEETIIDPATISAQLGPIRDTGLSVSYDQMIPGASGISAAVYGAGGKFTGGITIASPTPRMHKRRDEFCQLAMDSARQASALAGHAPVS